MESLSNGGIFTNQYRSIGYPLRANYISWVNQFRDIFDKEGQTIINKLDQTRSNADLFRANLQLIPGLGNFFSSMITLDLQQFNLVASGSTLCLGPGSIKGLHFIFGQNITNFHKFAQSIHFHQQDCFSLLNSNLLPNEIEHLRGVNLTFFQNQPLTLLDLENSLHGFAQWVNLKIKNQKKLKKSYVAQKELVIIY